VAIPRYSMLGLKKKNVSCHEYHFIYQPTDSSAAITIVIVTRSQSTGDVVATCHLSLMNQDNESLEIIDFDFFDDIEMVFVIKITSDRIPGKS
jgi:hypothetical protein